MDGASNLSAPKHNQLTSFAELKGKGWKKASKKFFLILPRCQGG